MQEEKKYGPNLNIIVGDYTYYDDNENNPEKFEKLPTVSLEVILQRS